MSIDVPPKSMPKLTWRQILAGVITSVIVVAGLVMLTVWTRNGSSAQADTTNLRRMPVNVIRVKHAEGIRQSRTFTGMVRAKNRSDLGFELSGKIVDVFVDEGDTISAGAAIARLDVDALIAQKNGVLARIEQARTMLAELESGPRTETIRAARANRDAARSQLDIANLNLKRRDALRERTAISIEEFDQASFALKTAQANFQAAQENLAELEAGTRLEKVDAQKAIVKQLEASLEEIEVALTKSTLISPFPGTITRRYLDPGSIAQASVPVVRLVDEQHLEAWIGLPVPIVAELDLSSEMKISVDGQPYQATLSAKIKELDATTRTQTVIFRMDNVESGVVSGQLCEIRIESNTEAAGFWVPTSALAKGVRGLWSVMALIAEPKGQGSRLEKRDVEVVHAQTDRVLVRGTLSEGDQVVADGVHRITNGQLVEPVSVDFDIPH